MDHPVCGGNPANWWGYRNKAFFGTIQTMKLCLYIIPVVFLTQALASTGDVIRTSADLASAVLDEAATSLTFQIKAKCLAKTTHQLIFEDATGAMTANWEGNDPSCLDISPGDELLLSGQILRITDNDLFNSRVRARCSHVDILTHGKKPSPTRITGREFISGRFDYKLVSLEGVVSDVVTDDIDPDFSYLFLICDGERMLVPLHHKQEEVRFLRSLVGGTVFISGICDPASLSDRRQLGRILDSADSSAIRIVAPPNADPFDVPHLREFYRLQPEQVSMMTRRKAIGRVIALWDRCKALIEVSPQQRVKVELSTDDLPSCNDIIETVGLPVTDLYHVNLAHAVWRPSTHSVSFADVPATNVSAHVIVSDVNGCRRFNSRLNGSVVKIKGVVRKLPSDDKLDPRLYVESDSCMVPVDVTAAPESLQDLLLESTVEISGVCILETETWRPNLAYPKITGFVIAIRDANDLHILALPSPWTPKRLLLVISILLMLLLLILAWSLSLRILANRRGHQLFREQIAHYEATLRVDERTKLAVELHDSLAQSLTGVFMELETAAQFGGGAAPELRNHLAKASSALKSCHNELRNCMWDLRNMSLEEKDMNTAIRKTLAPHAKGVDLAISFNISRTKFSDNTAHAILRIIRELVINAVRHGKAPRIWIAGRIENGKLLFSVRDNGSGFDHANCPGILQGHFGLEGIRERVGLLSGEFEITSEVGKGTEAIVAIRIPKDGETTRGLS